MKSGTQAAEYFGLNGRTVRRWIRSAKLKKDYYQWDTSTKDADLPMRYSLATQLLQKAEIKNWIIREFNLKDRSRSNLVRLIEQIRRKGVPVKEACEWLQVCRSSYYRWRDNSDAEPNDPLVAQIRDFQEAHSYAYGAKRMAVYLSRKNKKAVNHKKIARLMRLHGLNSRVRRMKIMRASERTVVSKEPRYNVLRRDFESRTPFEKMVTDMTFVPVVEGWLVLSAIKDLCSKKIVSYAFGASATIELALETLHGLPKEIEKVSDRLLHSDQGSCYTSLTYRETVSAMGMSCSFSRKGNCLDNAPMESFFGHLKSETIYRLTPSERLGLTREKAREIIARYITWYNRERIQRSLGYKSPEEVILSYAALRRCSRRA